MVCWAFREVEIRGLLFSVSFVSIINSTEGTSHCRMDQFHFYRPQRSRGKVMFLHVSVILFTVGGVWADIPPGADTPPLRSACREIRATGGLYASYWNAIFLFIYIARVIDTAASQLTKTAITVTAIFIVALGYELWYYVLGYADVLEYKANTPEQKIGKTNLLSLRICVLSPKELFHSVFICERSQNIGPFQLSVHWSKEPHRRSRTPGSQTCQPMILATGAYLRNWTVQCRVIIVVILSKLVSSEQSTRSCTLDK